MNEYGEVVRARAGLLRCCEPPAPAVAEFVAAVGAVAAWSAIVGRRAPATVRAVTAPRLQDLDRTALEALVDADLCAAAAVGARLVGPEDPAWPSDAFAGLELVATRGGGAQPLGLYVRGKQLWASAAVTVIGSRAGTPYGLRIAAELGAALSAAGFAVVSGAAYGVDTAAHRGALYGADRPIRRSDGQAADPGDRPGAGARPGADAGLGAAPAAGAGLGQAGAVSVAVLACGIDRAYPAGNAELLRSIASTGAVVSEYPPGTAPARYRFLVRNRLIAALGAATVVVEAGRRSGSLNTASSAEALSRTVMAIPGPVTSALSVGCHELIAHRGALLVTGPQDVLEALGPLSGVVPEPVGGLRATDELDSVTGRVYEALPGRGWRTVAELAVESALPGTTVMAALAELDLLGMATRDGPTWRRCG